MINQNLYLIGTVHIDIDGGKRLDTLLNKISPTIIALEFHKDRDYEILRNPVQEEKELDNLIDNSGLNLNSAQKIILKESGKIMSNLMGFEIRSSKNYVANNLASKLEYIDRSIFPEGRDKFMKGYNEALLDSFRQIVEQPELKESLIHLLDGGIDCYLDSIRMGAQIMYNGKEELNELMEFIVIPENLKSLKDTMPADAFKAIEQIYNPERNNAMIKRVRELYAGDSVNSIAVVTGLAHTVALENGLKDLKPKVISLSEYNSMYLDFLLKS